MENLKKMFRKDRFFPHKISISSTDKTSSPFSSHLTSCGLRLKRKKKCIRVEKIGRGKNTSLRLRS